MSRKHVAAAGECFSSIAKHAGLPSWIAVHRHPENEQLKSSRPNPNVIAPGDVIVVPELKAQSLDCATDAKHRFALQRELVELKVKVLDEGWESLAHRSYQLIRERGTTTGNLSPSGELVVPLTGSLEERVELQVEIGDDGELCRWELQLGGLIPVDDDRGLQMRLANLGIDPGPIDGVVGPLTAESVRRFQAANGLQVDGVPGGNTRAKLEAVCGV